MAARTTSSSNNGSSSSPISKIAQDQILSILLLLPIESILRFSMTCKKSKDLAYSDSLWESICRRDWGNYSVDAIRVSANRPAWKVLYQRVHQLDSVFSRRLLAGSENPEVFPSPRASHSMNLVSGCLVLFGGGSEGGRHLNDTWIAQIGDNFRQSIRWQKVHSAPFPSGRFGHSCVVINDSLILFGGINDHGVRLNDTWVGKITINQNREISLSWHLLDICSTAPPPPPRGAHAGSFLDEKKMLIHGGIGPSGIRLSDTWALHLDENARFGSWREISTRVGPASRSGHTLTNVDFGKTILFGGRGVGYEVLNDVWIFEKQMDRFEWIRIEFELRDVPQGFSLPRVGHSASLVLGRKLLIYGGENSNRLRKDDFWVLDIGPGRRMWKRVESRGEKPVCRSFHGACVDPSGRFLFVHGGMVDGFVQPGGASALKFDGEIYLVEVEI